MNCSSTYLSFLLFTLILIGCKRTNPETTSPSSFNSMDYVEAYFCCDYDEHEVTVENYVFLIESIGAALDTLSSPSRCVGPIAEMNAVLLKVDSIIKPEGFMNRKRAYNDYFSFVLDSLKNADSDPWSYYIAEQMVYDRISNNLNKN